jgi:glycosyltransferase involved in cell wall biosynthesis
MMKIVKIVASSGGNFYCENCVRDSTLTRALRQQGVDVVLVPLYLPLRADGEREDLTRGNPIFFGGINLYLKHRFRLFRKTPRWLDRLFDSKPMLALAAKQAGTTSPKGMGPMTLAMIKGEDRTQSAELERFLQWLEENGKPDLVHLTTSMLIGLARPIRDRLNVPVVCSAMDEDYWIDQLEEPYRTQCWEAMREKTADIEGFITVSDWYGNAMSQRLGVPRARFHRVYVGFDAAGISPAPMDFHPPTIGYLSKLTAALGLEALIDAFIALKQQPRHHALRLRALGGITRGDRRFIETLRQKLRDAGVAQAVDFIPEIDLDARSEFLRSLSVMSVPVPGGEAFGTFMLEAWAAGVPVVMPCAGAFPELVANSGGGLIYASESPDALAKALDSILSSPEQARRMGDAGRAAITDQFSVATMAQATIGIYEKAIAHAAVRQIDDGGDARPTLKEK